MTKREMDIIMVSFSMNWIFTNLYHFAVLLVPAFNDS
jgi:hypothetical protein